MRRDVVMECHTKTGRLPGQSRLCPITFGIESPDEA